MRHFDKEMSEEFRNNEVQYSRVVIEVSGEIIDDTFYGGEHILLDAEGSSLTYERLNEARTTGQFQFTALSATGRDTLDPIAGAILYPFAGTLVNGEAIWAPLGKLIIHETSLSRMPDAADVSVSLVDMTEKIRDNPFKAPFQTGGGTYQAAIQAIITDRYPTLAPFSMYLYSYPVIAPTVTYMEEEDPWSAVFKLATSSRSEIWLDKDGYLIYDETPDPVALKPVYELGGNQFKLEVGRRNQSVSRRDVFNGVIVRGEAPWLLFPIRGEFWDTDPSSPTWRFGPMGEKPYQMGDPIATTNAQCAEIAQTEYRKRAGVIEQITFNILKDPILEVGRMVSLAEEGEASKYFILDTLNFPMGGSPMSGTIRRRRL